MYPFEYHKAASVDDALTQVSRVDEGKYLAGGMTLIPTMKQRLAAPELLVDIGQLDTLSGIRIDNDYIVIGSMTTHATVERSPLVSAHLPGLAQLAAEIGDPQVRNRGTLGGSIANADPAADYPAAVLALAAIIVTNTRSIPADEFFIDIFETALEEHEIITEVRFPLVVKSGYKKFPNPASHYPVVGVFIAVHEDNVRVAVTGAAGCVFRCEDAEARLAGHFDVSALEGLVVDSEDFNEDIHATAQYRAHLIGVMASRLVQSMQ
ncbi:MAG: xanthine dehydrogenase family protein subunit M [Pseudomonadota bacterium]